MPDQLSVGTKKAEPEEQPGEQSAASPGAGPVAHASRARASGAATHTSKVGNARQSSPPASEGHE